MQPLSERPQPSDVAVSKAVIFRQQMEQRERVGALLVRSAMVTIARALFERIAGVRRGQN